MAAKKLIDRVDILKNLDTVIAPKYLPKEALDRNRQSVYGFVMESMSESIEDTVTLEQRRAADYCPELSSSAIRVRQTAKIRDVNIARATPGKAFAILGVLKEDIINKGTKVGNEIRFTIDRRSTIMHNGINFSLEDDILIRAVWRSTGYVYAASYTGEHSSYESYIQMYDEINQVGQEMVAMICQVYQYNYNIQEKTVTDEVEFLYEGLWFDYENKLAGFEVYYKQNSTGTTWKKLELDHYLTLERSKAIFYNDDDDNILYILNNPALNIGINAVIRVEIKETLGADGAVSLGESKATFSLYRDGTYNYSGINIGINMLTDTAGASDGDSLEDIKHNLIDAKTRRDNITTEHDILSYINDIDANVQIVKKRNDIEDRRYYMYTLLRHEKVIAPATTKRLNLNGIQSLADFGDFDHYDYTVNRKILRAYNKFQLHFSDGDDLDNDYVTKVSRDANEEGAYYLTCPFMILVDNKELASYYFTSVNESVLMSMRTVTSICPIQMIIRQVDIYRDAHDDNAYDKYKFTITGTMNTSTDEILLDEEGNLISNEAVMCYLVFRRGTSQAAYLPIPIGNYDPESRVFTFTGEIRTNDYITEMNELEITDGLYKIGKDEKYDSTIDFKDAYFDVYFMLRWDEKWEEAETVYDPKTDNLYQLLPSTRTDDYVLMCGFCNNSKNLYNLLIEYNKFTSSPVRLSPNENEGHEGTHIYSIGEVPFVEYEYGKEHIIDMAPTFVHMAQVYGSLLKLTTDFDVSLKFIATYGHSKYITVTGGRDPLGEETPEPLMNLNPTFYFKVYGFGVNLDDIYQFIYEYLRDTYITETTVFMSNICTLVEERFPAVRSIKYMGVDKFDASFQEFTYHIPDFKNIDMIIKYIPEQLNVTDIVIELDEDMP